MTALLASPHLAPLILGIKWMDPEWLLSEFGSSLIWLSLVIVFIECGLLFPFLPGDTLLFALGLFIAGSRSTSSASRHPSSSWWSRSSC